MHIHFRALQEHQKQWQYKNIEYTWNQELLEKWLISGTEWACKCFVVPETKQCSKDDAIFKSTREPAWRSFPWSNLE